jgi:hypothetical protein
MVNYSLEQLVEKGRNYSIWDYVLSFIYTIAHNLGLLVVKLITSLFGLKTIPISIVDPLGFLIVLTIFFILLTMAKKIAWIILIVGWVLLLIRIVIIVFKAD